MSMLTQTGFTSWEEYDALDRWGTFDKKEGYDLDQGYYLQKIQTNYEQSIVLIQRWQNEANRDIRFIAGDQNSSIQQSQPFVNSPPPQNTLTFNEILKSDNSIGGYQRRNRMASIIVPQHDFAQETADQKSKILEWCFQQDNTYEKISRCFDGARWTGLNFQAIWLDRTNDPIDGNILSSRLSYSQFIHDPYWESQDLKDCKWFSFRRWMHKSQAAHMMPVLAKEILALPQTGGQADYKFPFMPYAYNFAIKDMVSWDEYWETETRMQPFLIDEKTGAYILWRMSGQEGKFWEKMTQGSLKLIYKPVPTVRRTILLANRPMYTTIRPWSMDRYCFVPYLCYFYPEIVNYADRFQGTVRNARNYQTMYNDRMTANMAILKSQIDSGLKFKEGALIRDEHALLSGPGRLLPISEGASMDDVQTIPPPTVSQGSVEMQEIMRKGIPNTMGVTDEMLGINDNKDVSAMLAKARQGAALTTLQPIFDRLNTSQKLVSEIFDEMAENNFSIQKMSKILGKKPSKELFDKDFSKYSCQVVEGTLTDDQRQYQVLQWLQIQEITGRKIPPEVMLKHLNAVGKDEVIAAWQEEDLQQAQQAQVAQQIQIQQVQAGVQAMQSRSVSDEASAREKDTRALSNIGLEKERAARATQDRANAELANAKTMTEIQNLSLGQIEQVIKIIEQMKISQHNDENNDLALAQQSAERAQALGAQKSGENI